jgi:hypothetical protein
MKSKKRAYDLQNAKRSLRAATASRGQNTLPLHGPVAKVCQEWTKLVLRSWKSAPYGPGQYSFITDGSASAAIAF